MNDHDRPSGHTRRDSPSVNTVVVMPMLPWNDLLDRW